MITIYYNLNDKKKVYGKEGIKEYWVGDIDKHQIHVFLEPENDDYLVSKIISEGIINPQSFPNLELVINQLFLW